MYNVNEYYMLYTLCLAQLNDIKTRLQQGLSFTKEEAQAQLKIVDAVFNLAAGAAIHNGYKENTTSCLV